MGYDSVVNFQSINIYQSIWGKKLSNKYLIFSGSINRIKMYTFLKISANFDSNWRWNDCVKWQQRDSNPQPLSS